MAGMELSLELVLVLLLSFTLFHALRLERALRRLKQDRSELEGLIENFSRCAGDADASIARLHAAAHGAGRDLERHNAKATSLKGDLVFLTERAERLADRLEEALRAARKSLAPELLTGRPSLTPTGEKRALEATVRSKAERDLLHALKMAR